MERALAGPFVRLDKVPNYEQLSDMLTGMGPTTREELVDLIQGQKLQEEDEWEMFKGPKQGIVKQACELLEMFNGDTNQAVAACRHRTAVSENQKIVDLLSTALYRLTSDPSSVMMYLRSYQLSFKRFGPTDPDTDFLLACVLIRLDLADEYQDLIELVQSMGAPALSALYFVFENIPEREQKRRTILLQARILWSKMVAETRLLSEGRPPRMASG